MTSFYKSTTQQNAPKTLQLQNQTNTKEKRNNYLRICLLSFFVFAFTVITSAQVTGDYRSAATGNWTTLATWQRWNGTAWVTPTGVSPQGYPGQFAGTKGVLIQAANTVTLTTTINTQLMDSVTIAGTLFISGGNAVVTYQLNAPKLTIVAGGHINFNNKALLVLPSDGSIIIVNRTPTDNNDPNSALIGACNNNQEIAIGNITYAVCVGGGGCIDFAQLITDGGTIRVVPAVVIGSNSFSDGRVCFTPFSLTTRLAGFVFRTAGYPRHQWIQMSGPGTSTFSPTQAVSQLDSTVVITVSQPGTYVFNDYVTVPISSSCSNTFVTVFSSITIKVRPTPVVGIAVTGTPVCAGSTVAPVVSFTNSDTIPLTVTYNTNQTINVPASTTSTINVPTGSAGTFAYTLNSVRFADNIPGCSNAASSSVSAVITPVTISNHLDQNATALAAGATPIFNTNSSCRLIATIQSALTGGDITGNVEGRVWVENATPMFSGQPFVKRHYQITPANGPTGTARVTLYFTQQEFTEYNSVPFNGSDIPANPTDAAGKAALRVLKFAGSSSDGTGLPATYPGGPVAIDPDDADIVWDATNQRWAVTFSVNGFSGFIISNNNPTILPINLLQFNANLQNGNGALITWQTGGADAGIRYELQRSVDGRNFTAIHVQNGTASAVEFSYTDAGLNNGKYYYRLKMSDKQGVFTFSSIAILQVGGNQVQITVYPNPVKKEALSQLRVSISNDELKSYRLTDALGKVLLQKTNLRVSGSTNITLQQQLVTGTYYLQLITNNGIKTEKIIVE